MNLNTQTLAIAFLLCSLVTNCQNRQLFKDFDNGKNALNLISNHPQNVLLSESCKNCHTLIYNEWKHSLHHQAFSDKTFLIALQKEPKEWCVNCHAPLWDKEKELTSHGSLLQQPDKTPFLNEGVNCATCHLRNNKIISSKKNISSKGCILPLEYNQEIGTHKLCESCHQFNFLEKDYPLISFSNTPTQNTIEEFKNSYWYKNGYECQNCHFQDGKHNQNFPHFQNSLKENLEFQIQTYVKPDIILKVKLRFEKIGHNFPTGDLFRQIKIEAFSKKGVKLINYKIGRIYNIPHRKLLFDNSLKINSKQKGIEQDLWFQLDTKPFYCRITYQFQSFLEENQHNDIDKSLIKNVLYYGLCNTNK
jgi:hypothetical protein